MGWFSWSWAVSGLLAGVVAFAILMFMSMIIEILRWVKRRWL